MHMSAYGSYGVTGNFSRVQKEEGQGRVTTFVIGSLAKTSSMGSIKTAHAAKRL